MTPRSKKMYNTIAVIYFLLITMPFISQTAIAKLENKFPPLQAAQLDTTKCYHIISLGGGVGRDTLLPPNSLLSSASLVRLTEAIRIYYLLPCKMVITSGYAEVGQITLAEVALQAAISLGVKKSDLDFLPEPTTTEEEAEAYVKKFGTKNYLIIATSAIHMERAVYLFRKKGVENILAAPTDFKNKGPIQVYSYRTYLPRLSHMDDLKGVIHEIVGLWYAKLN